MIVAIPKHEVPDIDILNSINGSGMRDSQILLTVFNTENENAIECVEFMLVDNV